MRGYLYVIESFDTTSVKRWAPEVDLCFRIARAAELKLAEVKAENPGMDFRVTRYEAKEAV